MTLFDTILNIITTKFPNDKYPYLIKYQCHESGTSVKLSLGNLSKNSVILNFQVIIKNHNSCDCVIIVTLKSNLFIFQFMISC